MDNYVNHANKENYIKIFTSFTKNYTYNESKPYIFIVHQNPPQHNSKAMIPPLEKSSKFNKKSI